eukprot:COSAG02_NODE_796_length_17128_cov_176.587586_4_plen_173_part_00
MNLLSSGIQYHSTLGLLERAKSGLQCRVCHGRIHTLQTAVHLALLFNLHYFSTCMSDRVLLHLLCTMNYRTCVHLGILQYYKPLPADTLPYAYYIVVVGYWYWKYSRTGGGNFRGENSEFHHTQLCAQGTRQDGRWARLQRRVRNQAHRQCRRPRPGVRTHPADKLVLLAQS